jgi:hypothetical protein
LPFDDAGNVPGAAFTSPECSCAGGPANCAVWRNVFMTNYGWPDNSPPGAAISGGGPHSIATEGTGTYNDPITVASDNSFNMGGATLAKGTIVYNPLTQKYYVVEDGCVECNADYNCQYDDSEDAGPLNPPPGCKKNTYFHLDFWMGPNMSSAWSAGGANLVTASQNCEGITTLGDVYNINYAIDGGVGYGTTNGTVIINPPNNLPVKSGLLFDSSGNCWTNRQMLPIDMVCH